ncbi:hypothetical protein [Herbaspirillum sp. C7C8]|jgi:hypothetical protein|nr:hypothetical protein [Herbaspirillum sp. C7C8]MCI1006165.1 hypothetical protein [Herbaspirillum sp. C7C8]
MNDLLMRHRHHEIDIDPRGNFIGPALHWEDNQGYALSLTDEMKFYL